MQWTLQHGSFSSMSQPHIVWSVLCSLNIFPVQADDDGSGGVDSFVVGHGCDSVAGSWNSRVISSSVDGRSVARRPACWVEGAGVRYWPTLICCLHSLLTTPHLLLWATHQLSVQQIACSGSEQKMFRDRTGQTLFRAETVPETVPVLSLIPSLTLLLMRLF